MFHAFGIQVGHLIVAKLITRRRICLTHHLHLYLSAFFKSLNFRNRSFRLYKLRLRFNRWKLFKIGRFLRYQVLLLHRILNHINIDLILNIHWFKQYVLFLLFYLIRVDVSSLIFKRLRFHLNISHWLTNRLVPTLLNLIFNIINVFKLPILVLWSRRIIITHLSSMVKVLATWHHAEFWSFVMSSTQRRNVRTTTTTDGLPVQVVLLLKRCANWVASFVFFNRGVLTIVVSGLTNWIYFSHLNYRSFKLCHRLLLLTFELLEHCQLWIFLMFLGKTCVGLRLYSIWCIHLSHLRLSCHHYHRTYSRH